MRTLGRSSRISLRRGRKYAGIDDVRRGDDNLSRAPTVLPRRIFGRGAWINPRRSRLYAEIQDMRREEDNANLEAATTSSCAAVIRTLLTDAEDACTRGDIEAAWLHLFRAQEKRLLDYDSEQLDAVVTSLCAKIEDPVRLAPWRRSAIAALLEQAKVPGVGLATQRAVVIEALKLLNDGTANQYWRLSIARHYRVGRTEGQPVSLACCSACSAQQHLPRNGRLG